MRTSEELEVAIEYLRNVVLQLLGRIQALEKAESDRQAHEVTK